MMTEVRSGTMLIVGKPDNDQGVPSRLMVFDGQLIDRVTGKPAVLDFPNWTLVNVLEHKQVVRLLQNQKQ